jgi:hypothetical protein
VQGVNAGYKFIFSSTVTMGDPSPGLFRLNNATASSATAIAIDDTSADSGSPDVSAAILSWDDSTTTALRGTLLIKKISAPENFRVYSITGATTDNLGWSQLAVTHVVGSGSFANTDVCTIEFSRTGDLGVTGATGPTGPTGPTGATGPSVTVATQTFTSSGTYTPTSGMKYCIARVQAPGGGSGGADGVGDGGGGTASPGGGGGEYAEGVFSAATIGASKTVTIGAVGTAGSTSGGNGGTGGTTSLGALITAIGGSGGTGTGSDSVVSNQTNGGAGGTGGTGGDLRIAGGRGGHSQYGFDGTAAYPSSPGAGGDSFMGRGARGDAQTTWSGGSAAGTAGQSYGGGAAGAVTTSNTGQAGAAGGPGIIVVTEFI